MNLQDRIKQISKDKGYSHIGSCLSVLPILEHIYITKTDRDLVILDNAHAHVAHLVVREKYDSDLKGILNIESLLDAYGIHCDRQAGCDASGGSLGHGLGIAIGYALADHTRLIHVILSEGSLMEGSTWEALRIVDELQLDNIEIYLNLNGYSAVSIVNRDKLSERVKRFVSRAHVWYTDNGEGFEGIEGHYKKL